MFMKNPQKYHKVGKKWRKYLLFPTWTAVVVVGSFLYAKLFHVPAALYPIVQVWSNQLQSLKISGFLSNFWVFISAWTKLKSAVTPWTCDDSSFQSSI